MERLEGEDLAALLAREGPLPVGRAVALVVQACRGLAAAHASDIVHRDLKPANLFLTRRSDGGDLVKVLDFGIAKLLDADETGASITGTGKLLGTACYMPPEQAKGDPDIDHRADIYALGAILYELLTATKAHPGTNYNAVLFHILTQRIVPLRGLRPELPAGLDAVIERAMAVDRGARFARVADLGDALAPFAGTPLAATPAPARAAARAVAPGPALTIAPPVTVERKPAPLAAPGRGPGRALAGIGLALVAIAAAIVLARPRPPAVSSPVASPPPIPTAREPKTPPPHLPAAEPPGAADHAHDRAADVLPTKPRPHHKRRPVPNPAAAGQGGLDTGFDTRNPYE
jgi:serine/threonine-protein kinase